MKSEELRNEIICVKSRFFISRFSFYKIPHSSFLILHFLSYTTTYVICANFGLATGTPLRCIQVSPQTFGCKNRVIQTG